MRFVCRRQSLTLNELLIVQHKYPPASSLEGGNTRPSLQRAINCIPQRQNSHQGGKFGGLQSRLRKLGTTFQRGDQFVISIDCDQVLGDLAPPTAARDEIHEEKDAGPISHIIGKRDGGKISLSGNESKSFITCVGFF